MNDRTDPSGTPEPTRCRLPAWAVATAIYAGVAAVASFPILLHLRGRILGGVASDACTHVWTQWWTREFTFAHHALMFHAAPVIQFPLGGTMVSAQPLNDTLSIPLQWALGPVGAYNAVVVGHLVLAGGGGYALARYLLGDRRAAFLAGLVFGFSPFLLTYAVASGGSELVSVGWIPLATLFLLRTLRERRWRYPLLAGLCCAAIDLSCIYYVAVFALLAVVLVVYVLLAGGGARGDVVLDGDAGGGAADRGSGWALAARLALITTLTLAVAGPHVYLIRWALTRPDSILSSERVGHKVERVFGAGDDGMAVPQIEDNAYSHVELVNLVRPDAGALQRREVVNRFVLTPYVGYTVLALAIAGLALVRRRGLRLWGGVFLLFLGIAMGPMLSLADGVELSRPVSPLFLALYFFFPPHPVDHEAAYYVVSMLALALLAGAGAKALLPRVPARWRTHATGGAAALVLVDFLVVSPVPFPLPSDPVALPACYREHAVEFDASGALLELPFYQRGSMRMSREHFCYAPLHGRPIADTVLGYPSPYLTSNEFTKELLNAEGKAMIGTINDPARTRADFDRLYDDGFRWILADPSAYADGQWELARAVLTRHVDEIQCDDGWRAYWLEAPEDRPPPPPSAPGDEPHDRPAPGSPRPGEGPRPGSQVDAAQPPPVETTPPQ